MSDWGTRFSSLLERRTGIRLSVTILDRVGGVLQARSETLGFPSVEAYLSHLDRQESSAEFQKLVNLITVGKTSFNRYPEQIRAVVDLLVPALDRILHPARSINIWSAGCSTGEEPYTLAMALTDAGWFEKRRFRILGTDINTNSLEHARAARYFGAKEAKMPPFVRRFMEREQEFLRVSKEITGRVSFDHLNLNEPNYPDPGTWHVVICANVLIYFGAHTVMRVVERFLRAMSSDALLMLGGAESLTAIAPHLTLVRFGNTFGHIHGTWNGELNQYIAMRPTQRPAETPAPSLVAPTITPIAVPANQATSAPAVGAKPRAPAAMTPRGALQSAVVKQGAGAVTAAAAVAGAGAVAVAVSGSPAAELEVPSGEGEVDLAIQEAERGDRKTALDKLTALREKFPENPRVGRLLGLLLFNERRFAEACVALDEAIAADPLAFDLYFYQGWIHLALGHVDDARESLRRALFLEPGFTFARYEFALTLHKAGDFEQAVREYARAEQAAADPRVKHRLRERATGTNETFWIDDTFIIELCRSNRERAKKRLEPVTSGRMGSMMAQGSNAQGVKGN